MDKHVYSEKIAVIGVDGFEPSLAKKFLSEGIMPNLQKFIEAGSAREDLVLLGAMPTVTPPQWTTLATGAYPATHGITQFFNPSTERADGYVYALDSRLCLAEPLWNVFAEEGKKTLVWHWPGSSWPPTSESPNLTVVDGTQPAVINMGTAVVDWETIILGDENIAEPIFVAHDAPNNPGVGCVITDLDDMIANENDHTAINAVLGGNSSIMKSVYLDDSDSEISTLGQINLNVVNSPIRPAHGWANAPATAKEMIIITSNGFIRRPCLILQNADGIYDTVAIYKSKKEANPLFTISKQELKQYFIDDVNTGAANVTTSRAVCALEIAPDGSKVRLWMSVAYDLSSDKVWHPKEFYKEITENVGYVPCASLASGKNPEYAEKLLVHAWDSYCDWQGKALTYCMDNGFEVIFSHLHNVDAIGHQIWHFANHREEWGNDEVFYQNLIREVYKQTDKYLGQFLPYLKKDWTIIITSDHGLISEENDPVTGMGEMRNNGTVMVDLGYTTLVKDENGNNTRAVDLSKSKAVMNRMGYVNINLKGRYPDGIVDPSEKDALETQIISDLYNYRDPKTGRRTVAIALKNKDAAVLGLNGDRTADIVTFMEEDFNVIHADSLSTQKGHFDTSVSPIFVAAGKGIKSNFITKRVIRQVDVAPTIAVLGGVRMPEQCEGAPVYQIIEWD